MPIWNVVFYPAKGERNAPTDQLLDLCNKEERVRFRQKLELLMELEHKDWRFGWLLKIVREFYQVREGDFRGYFKTDGKKIVVLHFCRKVRQETKSEDLKTTKNKWDSYLRG
jgi:hypothetical protein